MINIITSWYAIAKSAIGPAHQAVLKIARWNRIWVVFGMQSEVMLT